MSHLDRDGVIRINIGLGRESFDALVGHLRPEEIDDTALDRFLPHPDYARQNFVCILNPSGDNVETLKRLLVEAHALAAARLQRRNRR